jgi:hypothetical protein
MKMLTKQPTGKPENWEREDSAYGRTKQKTRRFVMRNGRNGKG